MSETHNPFDKPAAAAHEVVIEFIRADKLKNLDEAKLVFTELLNHYKSEYDRVYQRKIG